MVTPCAFNCFCQRRRQLMHISMKTANFTFLLIAIFSFCSADGDSLENENLTHTPPDAAKEIKKSDSESKSVEKNANFRGRQTKPNFLVTPDQKLIMEPRLYYSQFANDGSVISRPGFPVSEKRRHNIYLSDHTGTYNVNLQNFKEEPPSHLQTALGAISAHILNQQRSQEYVPYPPNGDPYRYSAYRGRPGITEPPAVKAYERASNFNYDAHSANFDQQNLKGLFSTDDYRQSFSNHFQNFGAGFYNNPEFYNDGVFYPEPLRNLYEIYDSRRYDQGDAYKRPVK